MDSVLKCGYTMEKKIKIQQQQAHPGDFEALAMFTPWLMCKMDFYP